MDISELKKIFDLYYEESNDLEVVIQKLKDYGASQMECTRTLVLELKMSLPKADNIVVNSKAWSENKNDVIEFRNNLFDSTNLNEEDL